MPNKSVIKTRNKIIIIKNKFIKKLLIQFFMILQQKGAKNHIHEPGLDCPIV